MNWRELPPAYFLLPLDLVPDFLSVSGHADEVIIVALILPSAHSSAGPVPLSRHWAGTPFGPAVMERLAVVDPSQPGE